MTTGLIIHYHEITFLVTSLLNVYVRVGTEDMKNRVVEQVITDYRMFRPLVILLSIC